MSINILTQVMTTLYNSYKADFLEFGDEDIEEDLSEAGFTENEIVRIMNYTPNYDDICKFIAYDSLAYDDYNTINELKENIFGHSGIMLNDTNILNKILNYKGQIHYEE